MDRKVIIYPVFVPMVGCPHQCAFCNQGSITGRTINNLLDDIKTQLDMVMSKAIKGGAQKEIAFFGGSFTCLSMESQDSIFNLAHPYLRAGYSDGIRISTRPDYISDSILENLQRNGLTTIELGIQSTDPKVLEASERGYFYEGILPHIQNLKSYGFKLGLQMMVGLPYDTRLKSLKTAMDFAVLNPDFVRIYPTLVLRNSSLEKEFQGGQYKPLSLDEAVEWVRDIRVIFERHNIPVIRTGLQAQEGFDRGKDLIAGPYHPAFGEMVESAIYRMWMGDIIESCIEREKGISFKSIGFHVPSCRLSQAIGQKKANLIELRNSYPHVDIRVEGDKGLGIDELRAFIDEIPFLHMRQAYISQKYEGISREMGN